MDARMRRVERPSADLLVVASGTGGGCLPLGRWARFQRAWERAKLLLESPIASFRWARAKRRAADRKKPTPASGWQGRRKNSLAECEQDGIVMGF